MKAKNKTKSKKAATLPLPCEQDPHDPRYWLAQYNEARDSVQDLHAGVARLLAFDPDDAENLLRVRDFVKAMRALAEFARLVGLSETNGWSRTLDEQRAAWDLWFDKFARAAAAEIPY